MRNAATATKKTDLDPDLIWGAADIGAFIGRTASQVYYLHENGLLCGATFKIGRGRLVASRAKLRALPELLASETT